MKRWRILTICSERESPGNRIKAAGREYGIEVEVANINGAMANSAHVNLGSINPFYYSALYA